MRGNLPAEDDEERSLVRRTGHGDREAFEKLYLIYEKRLLAYLMSMVRDRDHAEDLVVEVMLAVWQGAMTFKGASRPSSWIFGIAHNKALNWIRKMGREISTDLDEAESRPSPEPDPCAGHLARERREKIAAALEQLSVKHREVIELTFYHGFSYEEIGRIVGCPANTVKTRMFYGTQHLRRILTEMGVDRGF